MSGLFETFVSKAGKLFFVRQSSIEFCSWIVILVCFEQNDPKSISHETFKSLFAIDNRQYLQQRCQKKLYEQGYKLFKRLLQNTVFSF